MEHFAQEERWMLATGFSADNCHASHHNTILDTMRAVEEHYLKGDNEIIQRLAEALVEWFPQHAASMDAGLALHPEGRGLRFGHRNPGRPRARAPCLHERLRQRHLQLTTLNPAKGQGMQPDRVDLRQCRFFMHWPAGFTTEPTGCGLRCPPA